MPQDGDGPKPGPNDLRNEVLDFSAYVPGRSIDEIRREYGLSQVVKLASNENPLGASPLVCKTLNMKSDTVFRYPQAGTPRLVQALAEKLGVDEERIVVGNGSDEIIDLLIRVRTRPGQDNVLAFRPCFSMYELQAKLQGVEFRQADLEPETLAFDWDAFLAAADENTALAFVTSPDNPSGHTARAEELAEVARALPPKCLMVLDEAYMEFAEPQERYSLLSRLQEFPNLVILRTFSKMYGLAGLRLGYGIMPTWLADYMWRVRLPFSVNILAEEAGIAALADETFQRATLETVTQGREYLTRELTALGFTVYPSQANFLLIKSPPDRDAKEIYQALLERGMIIRPLGSGYNMPDHLRVTVGAMRENRLLMELLEDILGKERGDG